MGCKKEDYEKVWLNCFGDKKDRQDPFGRIMKFGSYGKQTNFGWEIDHIWPLKPKEDNEGFNGFVNRQPLHWESNNEKDNLLKGKVNDWNFEVKKRYTIKNERVVGYMLVEEDEDNPELVEWYDYEDWQ